MSESNLPPGVTDADTDQYPYFDEDDDRGDLDCAFGPDGDFSDDLSPEEAASISGGVEEPGEGPSIEQRYEIGADPGDETDADTGELGDEDDGVIGGDNPGANTLLATVKDGELTLVQSQDLDIDIALNLDQEAKGALEKARLHYSNGGCEAIGLDHAFVKCALETLTNRFGYNS